MRHRIPRLLPVLVCLCLNACQAQRPAVDTPVVTPDDTTTTLSRIAFGSCSEASQPVPVFGTIAGLKPDLMIFLGDNVYADTTEETELVAAYRELANNPDFQKLVQVCPILATWDDHDYGLNDSGAEHPTKVMSQRVFLDFWNEPRDSPRRKWKGVYGAKIFGPSGKRVQVILLDTRYHRNPLAERSQEERARDGGGPYKPNTDPAVTMLGEEQWRWLQEQLKQPAELRLIASSVQVVSEEHHWEGWAMMPAQRNKLIKLIRDTNADGVVFISGDRHRAELSRLADAGPYPLYDVTASSFNRPSRENNEPNRHRVGKQYPAANFGLIEIDWQTGDPGVTLSILDKMGTAQVTHRVALSELTPKH